MKQRKEWIKLKHSPSGTYVTCTLQEDNLTVSWTVKTFTSGIKSGLAEARKGADTGLTELKQAL